MAATNLIAISALIAFAFLTASPYPTARTKWLWIAGNGGHVYFIFPLQMFILAWFVFNVVLVGTLVWINARD